ncbi:MAG: hypothetical protein EPO32_06005 [Anaerolineae bacterium]|nr:MAG: hypothetical protein EPO32_06005 [Anaerolineae bacterium]
MSESIRLLALKCPQCSTSIPAGLDEVAWTCATCKTGLLLDEEKTLARLAFHYGEGIPAGQPGRPFWVAQGKVTLNRESRNMFGKDDESFKYWAAGRRFFIPAYACDVDELVNMAITFLNDQPDLKPGPAVPFHPVTMLPGDMMPVAEYVVVGVEALRKDQVKKVNFTLDLSEPELWILP